MYLLVAVISQEHVIYLYADSDSNAFNGNSRGEGPARVGSLGYMTVCCQRTPFVFAASECEPTFLKKIIMKHGSDVSGVCAVSARGLFLLECFVQQAPGRPLGLPTRDLLS